MQFLTDENIPFSLVKVIRQRGFSVKDIKEEKLVGVKDRVIMALSKKENRVIITLDKDFATYPLKNHAGVILLRYTNKSAPNLAEQFVFFLESPLLEKVDHTLCEVFEGYVRIHKNQNT